MQLDLEKNVHMELLTINEGTKVEFINIDFDIQSKKGLIIQKSHCYLFLMTIK